MEWGTMRKQRAAVKSLLSTAMTAGGASLVFSADAIWLELIGVLVIFIELHASNRPSASTTKRDS